MKKKLSVLMAAIISITSVSFTGQVFAYEKSLRIAGNNRYDTSYKVSARNKGDIAVLANGMSFPDSLSAVNLANKFKASIILTNNNPDIKNILKSRGIKTVYLIGGVNTISQALEDDLKTDFNLERVFGNDRYETSRATIAKAGYTKLGVASGEKFPDALSASALLNQENAGLLLVDGKRSYTPPNGSEIRYTFGGPKTIMQNGGERIYGNSRYETAVKIAKRVTSPNSIAAVSGTSFPDALSAANLVITDGAVILPVQRYPYREAVEMTKDVAEVFIVGGETSVSAFTQEKLLDNGSQTGGNTDSDIGLRPDQKEFLDNLEDLGNNINDRIDDVEDIVDKLNDMPHLDLDPSSAIDKVSSIIDKINNVEETINNILNNNFIPDFIKDKLMAYADTLINPLTRVVVRTIKFIPERRLVSMINELNKTSIGKKAIVNIGENLTSPFDIYKWNKALAKSDFSK